MSGVMGMNCSSKIIPIKDSSSGKVYTAYRVFERGDGKRLVFYPVPKNANSSFKLLFSLASKDTGQLMFFDDEVPMSKKEFYKKQHKIGRAHV